MPDLEFVLDQDELTLLFIAVDRGRPIADIAADFGVKLGDVYALLREHRPGRKKMAPGRPNKTNAIEELLVKGVKPAEIAKLTGRTRQYVYKVKAHMDSGGSVHYPAFWNGPRNIRQA